MFSFTDSVAIATLSTHVISGRSGLPRAGVVAALRVIGPPRDLVFDARVHVPTTSARLTAWLNELVANDPMLVGYKLARISRHLRAAGYRRDLLASFSQIGGRYDVLDVVRGCPTPLSILAVMHGVQAVDEEALTGASSVTTNTATNLALINAVASWVIFLGRQTPGKRGLLLRRRALAQLSAAIDFSPGQSVLAAALMGPWQ